MIPDKDYTHQPGFDFAQPSVVERSRNHKPGYIYYRESPYLTQVATDRMPTILIAAVMGRNLGYLINSDRSN